MKILIAGDLHYNKNHFEFVKDRLVHCDCLCLMGDYLDDRLLNLEEQVGWVSRWVKSIEKPVFMCSGNHDLDHLAECEWLYVLASSTVKIDNQIGNLKGIVFGVVPYIGADYTLFADCDVLVTHLPPQNTPTAQQGGDDFGDDALYDALKMKIIEPSYIFCGHVEKPDSHEANILNTKIINPGALWQLGSRGYHILTIP